MLITFDDSNVDRLPGRRGMEYNEVVKQAIEACRPHDESWTVSTHQAPTSAAVIFRFVRGTDMPRLLPFLLERDNATHLVLHRTVCAFLHSTWGPMPEDDLPAGSEVVFVRDGMGVRANDTATVIRSLRRSGVDCDNGELEVECRDRRMVVQRTDVRPYAGRGRPWPDGRSSVP